MIHLSIVIGQENWYHPVPYLYYLGSSISEQDWQDIIDKPDPGIPEDWKDLIDAINSKKSNQDQHQPMDQSSPGTSNKYWKPTFDIINPNIPSQDPIDESGSGTFDKYSKQPIDQPGSNTFEQEQQQSMDEDKSGNTAPSQVTGLRQRYQRTFNRIKQRLEQCKELRKKKRQEYRDCLALKSKQQLANEEEISGSEYNPDTENQLKQECRVANQKIASVRQDLKRFMKRRGLEFQKLSSD
ncbi:hypothetical protein QVD99_006991 [Batrachochytrium dendrobatidis]|nr:hypothetical protein QVD99_006991 [Batrachochytrium dendrobatidis]